MPMMRLTIPAFVIVLLAAATVLLRSPSRSADISSGTAAMPSLQELHAAVGVHKLPVQEIEDQSLIFTAPAKR
jgi:hypothetical protein